jgi:hypothetical protein
MSKGGPVFAGGILCEVLPHHDLSLHVGLKRKSSGPLAWVPPTLSGPFTQ